MQRIKSTKKTIEDVNDFRKEIKKAVDIQCDALIDTVRKPNIDKNDFIDMLQQQKQNVDQLIMKCKENIWEGKLDLIEYNPPSPNSLIPNYDRPLPQIPIFEPEKKVLDFIRNGIGKIKYVNREKEGSTASGSVSNVFDDFISNGIGTIKYVNREKERKHCICRCRCVKRI